MMLTPIQQATTSVVTSTVRSVLDDIEKRRVEDEEKLKGTKDDKIVKAKVKSDDVKSAANARINEHFFGALKREENPLASLIASFAAAIGITPQGADETEQDFGTRIGDELYFADIVTKQYSDGKAVEVGLKTFKVSAEQLRSALDGSDEQPSVNAQFLARFVAANGLEQAADETDTDYGARIGAALTEARKDVPTSVAEVENRSGLTKLGLSASQMVEAIKAPYGQAAQAIKAVLDEKASTEKGMTADISKVLQRLEEVADPKTLEELKLGRLEKDITKVEDAETRAERETQIRSLEAGDKLEDVKTLQEAVKKGNDAAADKDGKPGDASGAEPSTVAIETIQVLAAGAEIAQTEAAVEAVGGTTLADEAQAVADATDVREAPTSDEQAVMLARAGQADSQARKDDAQADILSIKVDENGIYDLLARKNAAVLS